MPAPRRKWSQHWLASPELARSLVRLVQPRPGDRFLEIGAGRGRLTQALLEHPVAVVAVEVDPACCAALQELTGEGTLTVVVGDILEVDPWKLPPDKPLRSVGNLPYAICSPILAWTVEHRSALLDAHYMLPADVATRVRAAPGSRRYGALSVKVQWFYQVEELRRIGPGGFRPPPAVDSSFVRLTPRPPPDCGAAPDHLQAVVEGAFAHRRKTLVNSLRRAGWEGEVVRSACADAGVDPGARAETLSLQQFARLAERLPPVRQ